MTTDPGAPPAGRVAARPAEVLLVEDSPSDAAMTCTRCAKAAPTTGCTSWVTAR